MTSILFSHWSLVLILASHWSGSAVSHVLLMIIAAGAIALLVNAGTWLWGSQSGHHYMGYEAPSPYGV